MLQGVVCIVLLATLLPALARPSGEDKPSGLSITGLLTKSPTIAEEAVKSGKQAVSLLQKKVPWLLNPFNILGKSSESQNEGTSAASNITLPQAQESAGDSFSNNFLDERDLTADTTTKVASQDTTTESKDSTVHDIYSDVQTIKYSTIKINHTSDGDKTTGCFYFTDPVPDWGTATWTTATPFDWTTPTVPDWGTATWTTATPFDWTTPTGNFEVDQTTGCFRFTTPDWGTATWTTPPYDWRTVGRYTDYDDVCFYFTTRDWTIGTWTTQVPLEWTTYTGRFDVNQTIGCVQGSFGGNDLITGGRSDFSGIHSEFLAHLLGSGTLGSLLGSG